jgi:hypothetical protein
MKKENLIWIAAVIVVVCLIIKARKMIAGPDIIKLGDKSNEVAGLQYALSSMTGVKFNSMGAYDTDTLNAVKYYMENTNSLRDYDKGYVDKKFASDLFAIQNKLKA